MLRAPHGRQGSPRAPAVLDSAIPSPLVKPLLALGSLLFSTRGRIGRATLWWTSLAVLMAFVLVLPIAERASPRFGVAGLDLLVLVILGVLSTKRLHDRGRSPWSLLVVLVPVLGPLWLFVELGLRKGTEGENHYGLDPRDGRKADYLTVAADDPKVVVDVTGLYRTPVFAVAQPTSVEALQEAMTRTNGPVSIGGGRFSMGGQVASPDSLHIDMRKMNRVLSIDLDRRTIRVQAGIRWCDIQRAVDPHDLAVKIMQTYANFTVGGSLSVNCHGRYVGLGPVILSVRSIVLVLASGERVDASPTERSELFYGAIGGYGALGVIAEAELELAENTRVEQRIEKVPVGQYVEWFQRTVRDDAGAVFHNGDLYVPGYETVNAVTWVETKKPVTTRDRLMEPQRAYLLYAYLFWAVSETPLGKWRRRYLIEPLFYLKKRVHWRNYEAGYDVGELEPPSRVDRTYVLQEYFVPVAAFDAFVPKMAAIFQRHRVNMLNVSIRHALPDPGSMLAWAREECFAFVCYYKQRTRDNARDRVAVWTRELIDAVIEAGGTYYLPYQPHATAEQLRAAYPRIDELFALKRRLDPDYRLRGALWDRYYAPTLEDAPEAPAAEAPTDFHVVFGDVALHDDFYAFLQNIFHLYPEDRFHSLLKKATAEHTDEATIFRVVQEQLPDIKPAGSELTYALPSLKIQKQVMTEQTLALLGDRRRVDGYVEIGTTGRYVGALDDHLEVDGDIVLVHDVAPTMSPVDVIERGQIAKLGRHVPLDDYRPIPEDAVPSESVDLVTCYIGLHHIEPDGVAPFLRSIHRVLRPGGVFIVRDHDVTDAKMDALVALAHTVFNIGLGETWAFNQAERRHFAPIETWAERIVAVGFEDQGERLYQDLDPTKNALLAFVKEAS
ncbi:MAG: FAD-binding protein [Sandaracinaceae bacterium]|nr:FAD-binding protein [Sandaracinaceae bacterium]